MKKYNDGMTTLIGVLAALLAILFLYLFADYKIWSLQDRMYDEFLDIVRHADSEIWKPGFSPEMNEEEMLELYHQFLKEVSERLDEKGNVLYYGNLVYTNGTYMYDRGIMRPDKRYDKKLEVPDADDLGMSEVAREINERAVGGKVITLDFFGEDPWLNLYGVDAFSSYCNFAHRFHDHYQYQVTFAYSPIKIVLSENLTFFITFPFVVAGLECAIAWFFRKRRKRDRFKDRMASTLTTGFAHELKTPLAVMKVSVENWDYIEEADKPEYMEKITAEMDHLETLVKKLTDVNRVPSREEKLKNEKVNLYSVAEEVLRQQNPVLEERNLKVSFHADEPEDCMVAGDPEMLRIAIGNFISNAIKYSGSSISIELKAGKKVRFQVKNDGVALSKEAAGKVWELFYKTDAARTDRMGSSGVGLAVTKSILKAHKAKFGCIPGNGETTFWFEMKSADSDELENTDSGRGTR